MALIAGTGWAVAVAVMKVVYLDRALPGTEVAGVALGGADSQTVRGELNGLEPPPRVVRVAGAGRRFTVSSRDIGTRVDVDRSVREVLDAGHRGVGNLIALPAGLLGVGRDVEPVYTHDPPAVRREAARIARAVDRPAFRGSLSVDPETLTARVRFPRPGRRVEQLVLARAIGEALRQDEPADIDLPVRNQAVASRAAANRVATAAEAYLRGGAIRVRAGDTTLRLAPREFASVLALRSKNGRRRPAVGLGIDRTAMARLVATLSARYDRPHTNARIQPVAPGAVLEAKGDVAWRPRATTVDVSPARFGRALDRGRAIEAIAAAVRERRYDIVAPTRRVPPRVTASAARRVNSLIGTFTTRFACCEPRAKNIRLIARAVDGEVVAAGGRFSLNAAAGPRTRARGFVKAPFIADGKLVPSIGGGVSQFSTTLYNAAFFAGVRLDAHQPHSFYIDRYPPGREATLDYGSIDLVWTNDTRTPILVRATTTPDSVTVSLYGEDDGRRVRALTGPRRAVAGRAFSITVTRVLRRGDGRVARQPVTAIYDEPPSAP